MPYSFAQQFDSDDGKLSVLVPDKVNRMKFFPIVIQVNDEDREKYDTIDISGGCYIAISNLPEIESEFISDKYHKREYNAQKEIRMLVALYIGDNDLSKTPLITDGSCSVMIYNEDGGNSIYTVAKYDLTPISTDYNPPYDAINRYSDESNLGLWEIEDKDNIHDFYTANIYVNYYIPYSDDEVIFDLESKNYEDYFEYSSNFRYGFSDLKTESSGGFGGSDASFYKIGFSSNLSEFAYENLDDDEKEEARTLIHGEMILFQFYETFLIRQYYDVDKLIYYKDKDKEIEELKSELLSIAKTFSISSSGVNNIDGVFEIEEEKEEVMECDEDSHCDKGYSCSMCRVCEPNSELYSEDEVEISDFNIEPEFTSNSIYNKITSRIIIRNYMDFEFENKKGETVDVCEIKLGSFDGLKIKGEIESSDPYSGFTTGMLLSERKKNDEWKIEPGNPKAPESYHFVISPNDRVKVIGELFDVEESVKIQVENDGEILFAESYEYVLKPIEMNIDFKTQTLQMQDDSSKAVYFTVTNPTAEYLVSRIRAMTVGGIELAEPGDSHIEDDIPVYNQLIITSIEPNKENGLAYYSPELSNINIGAELQSLSMWDLQVQAHKDTLVDGAMAYGGETMAKGAKKYMEIAEKEARIFTRYKSAYTTNPSKMKNFANMANSAEAAEKFAKNANKANKFFDVENKFYNVMQVEQYTSNAFEGAQIIENDNEAGYIESGAQIMVTSIDVLQGAVGAVGLVTNKIPVVGKLTAGAQTAFSWAANVWKANFKYIAHSERIERSSELTFPAMILVEVSDESGWTTNGGITIAIKYQYLGGNN